MLKLYYSPAACSLAVHIALEESALPHQLIQVSTRDGETRRPPYLAVNPMGQVPALVLPDGQVLTQVLALLSYVADQVPQRRLLPTRPVERAHALAWTSLFASSVHGAFRDWFRPDLCTPEATAHQAIRSSARERYFSHLALLDSHLGARPWMLGEEYSLVDANAYCFYLWGQIFEWPVTELGNLRDLARRVDARPATRRALAAEGFTGSRALHIH